MTWVNERDLLIAQTMAFVKSVTGNRPEPEARIELTTVDEIHGVETPVAVVPTSYTLRLPRDEVRDEIQGRVAAFRAHQQLFQRERDDYFSSVLAKARARTSSNPKVPGTK